jgi:hypothetical protein
MDATSSPRRRKRPMTAGDNDRLDRLEQTVERGFEKMEQLISGLDARLRKIETSETGCRIETTMRTAAVEKDLSGLKLRVDQHDADVKFLLPWVRGLRWVVGVLGGSVILLLWGLLTGQVQLIFK